MASNVIAKKSLGQHWLDDKPTLEMIADYADLDSSKDVVLEIGPGLGSLTRVLSGKTNKVIAIELDPELYSKLKGRVNAENLEVVKGDILKFDLNLLPRSYKIVANIPYYLTSNLIRVLSESNNPPELAVLLVQKEVAERLGAQPGSMSLLSITAQFYWQIEIKNVIPAAMFSPPPKVDSQIVILRYRSASLFSDIDPNKFFRLVKIGFSARRKTLHNSLANGFRANKGEVAELLVEAKLDPNTRPQNLSMDSWHDLYKVCLGRSLI